MNKVQLTNENLENKIIELEDCISNLEKQLTDNEIKCDFTEYESESGGVSGIKLDKKGSVILKKINETEISVEKWIQKPELEGNDLSYGEDVIFSKM